MVPLGLHLGSMKEAREWPRHDCLVLDGGVQVLVDFTNDGPVSASVSHI